MRANVLIRKRETVKEVEIIKEEKLTASHVRRLVLRGLDFVRETKDELKLPLFRKIEYTKKRLKHGIFKAKKFPFRQLSHSIYAKAYGYFKGPSTIVLDEDLPLSGKLFDQPLLATTATHYCATHEAIHADDYTDDNRIIKETLRHIEREHKDELAEASALLSRYSREGRKGGHKKVMDTWAYQYADSATHYRTYLVLNHKRFPKLDNIWVSLYNSIFSPRMFTAIEEEKGISYTANLLSKKIGKICIIEIVKELEEVIQKKAGLYII